MAETTCTTTIPGAPQAERRCGRCTYFANDPALMEEIFRGLNVMSSGYASVRAHDGLCSRHDVYLSYRDTCGEFSADGGDQTGVTSNV